MYWRSILLKLFHILPSLLAGFLSYSQVDRFWHMGSNGCSLEQNNNVLVTNLNTIVPFGWAGCSVLCEPSTGELVFYTDGQAIVDASGSMMPSATNLPGGNSTHGSGKIVPVPGSCDLFYVFSISTATETTNTGSLSYVIVDMTIPGNGTPTNPLGDVTQPSIDLQFGVSEGLEVVKQSDSVYYLISPMLNSSTITVWKIDDTGITMDNVYTMNNDLGDPQAIRYSPTSQKLALGSFVENDPLLIFDFNPNTGVISNEDIVPGSPFGNSSNQYSGIIDVEWSNSGNLLYISKYRGNTPISGGALYQYDITNSGTDAILIHQISNSPVHVSKGLRRSSNGMIYYLAVDPITVTCHHIAAIENPDTPGLGCNLNLTFHDTEINLNLTGLLPNFVSSSATNPPPSSLTTSSTIDCNDILHIDIAQILLDNQIQNASIDTVIVFATNYECIDGICNVTIEPNTSNPVSIDIQVSGMNCAPPTTINLLVNYEPFTPLPVELLAEDSILCAGIGMMLEVPNTYSSYSWNTGSTNNSITPETTGWYSVEVTDANNCSTTDSLYFQTSAFVDPTLSDLVIETCSASYEFIAPVNSDNVNWTSPNSNPTGIFNETGIYTGEITYSDGCTQAFQLNLSLLEEPQLTSTNSPIIELCPGATETLTVVSSAPVTWNTGSANANLTITQSGTYTATSTNLCGTDEISFEAVMLEPLTFTLGDDIHACNTIDTVITVSNLPNYLWNDGSITSSLVINTSGTYWLSSQNQCGVVSDTLQVVTYTEQAPVDYEDWAQCFGSTMTITAPPGLYWAYDWSDGSTANTITVTGTEPIQLNGMNSCGSYFFEWQVGPTDCSQSIYVPNSFTPNGDGRNDVWLPETYNLTILSIKIFNRWGQKVFEGDEE
ncbi:MAG: hypothetical protein RLZZ262_1864, partial [Bacteroidota bacterium]